MPIYEYQCLKNGHVFELFQNLTDPSPKKCLNCNSSVRKIVSKSSFLLKGSGWYVTDYARKTTSEPKAKTKKACETEPKENITNINHSEKQEKKVA